MLRQRRLRGGLHDSAWNETERIKVGDLSHGALRRSAVHPRFRVLGDAELSLDPFHEQSPRTLAGPAQRAPVIVAESGGSQRRAGGIRTPSSASSIFVLNPTASGALTLSGGVSIAVPGAVVVESNSARALFGQRQAPTVVAPGRWRGHRPAVNELSAVTGDRSRQPSNMVQRQSSAASAADS
jgi:hypothetical protein